MNDNNDKRMCDHCMEDATWIEDDHAMCNIHWFGL